jgi:hypothetical protein
MGTVILIYCPPGESAPSAVIEQGFTNMARRSTERVFVDALLRCLAPHFTEARSAHQR